MTRPRSEADEQNLELTGRIVAAYLIRNVVSIGDLPCVIEQTYAALRGASRTLQATQQPVVQERRRPAVPVRKAVTEDFIICLEDGKKFKLLRRHLMTKYGADARTISPEMETPG
ncbi:putative transcriptional regulator [Sinorhizobium kostiense]|uniref:Transcriptional regulator n=1 Tax=Sinorhizobium kostiense TaxID=76747 RepID=A0ABS4R7X6_9HYPH|nr:putative transcriptional regulator [Sinorhizobium kostiense]